MCHCEDLLMPQMQKKKRKRTMEEITFAETGQPSTLFMLAALFSIVLH